MTDALSDPTLGVAIATFNGARYLAEQLESIRLQTKKVNALVVYDDGSNDETLAVAKRYNDIFCADNIDYSVMTEKNVGYCKNFERAISVLTTDLIFLCDQDDVWLPEKVEECVKIFSQYKDLNVLFTDAFVTNCNLEIRKKISDIMKYPSKDFTYPCNWPVSRNTCVGATMVLKRTFLKSILPIPSFQRSHDAWIARVAALNNCLAYLPKPMIYYRQHENNVIGAGAFNKSKLQKDRELKELDALHRELNEVLSLFTTSDNSHYVKAWLHFVDKRKQILNKPLFLGSLEAITQYRRYRLHLNGIRSWLKDIIILGDRK